MKVKKELELIQIGKDICQHFQYRYAESATGKEANMLFSCWQDLSECLQKDIKSILIQYQDNEFDDAVIWLLTYLNDVAETDEYPEILENIKWDSLMRYFAVSGNLQWALENMKVCEIAEILEYQVPIDRLAELHRQYVGRDSIRGRCMQARIQKLLSLCAEETRHDKYSNACSDFARGDYAYWIEKGEKNA